MSGAGDPVAERRARLALAAGIGQRIGYALYLVAILAFSVGLMWGFTNLVSALVIVALLVGSAVLAPAIVLHHAVVATEREERRSDGR